MSNGIILAGLQLLSIYSQICGENILTPLSKFWFQMKAHLMVSNMNTHLKKLSGGKQNC